MDEKVIAFDIWGDYAYFRRGYTSTSTISYPFPSRTTISGLIAGILGLEKDSYHDIFNEQNSKLGLRILNPINKININLNYINTKEGFILRDIKNNPRVQVQAEFLKDVKYRIYVSLNDKILDLNHLEGNDVEINSIILKDKYDFVIEPKKRYGVIKSPGFMNSERAVSKFIEYYYEKNGSSIKIKNGDYYLVGDDKVVLF